ncbi:unnamed protein product [Pleuronectes platessa]|uniref:Uncharacterized protein n=1 Tax=Pleuronectes platessa TaxID=8262 RepID=A0A9N7Z0T7_PLEPL|nr:unnamed protein product [Pleuronectes platessa]
MRLNLGQLQIRGELSRMIWWRVEGSVALESGTSSHLPQLPLTSQMDVTFMENTPTGWLDEDGAMLVQEGAEQAVELPAEGALQMHPSVPSPSEGTGAVV